VGEAAEPRQREEQDERLCGDQPRNRGAGENLPDDHGRGAGFGYRPRVRDVPELAAIEFDRGPRQARAPGRGAAHRAAGAAGRDHHARDGQAAGAGARRDRLLRRHLLVLRRQRARPDEGRADRAARGTGFGDHPPQPVRRDPRHHAVELSDVSGRTLRRAEPGHRQRRAPEACAPVPRDGSGAAADLPRRGLPGGRLRQHLRHQRPDRQRDRRPARAGRVGDGIGAGRRGGRGDRGEKPEEGRPGAGRLRSVHPPQHRRHGQDGRATPPSGSS
jgi:hypothetical protein